MARVLLTNVDKIYDTVKVVDDLSLNIEHGQFVVLVGPSGCGKSTTLRMIAGLEDVSSGEIRIGDRVMNDVPPKDRDIAMVFQSYALYPHMSAGENMAFALRLQGVAKDEVAQRVAQAAQVLGIEGLLDRKPKALSGGQRQRVALGRAIVRKPQCFLFDEPLSNLDAKLRVEMRAEIKQLHLSLGSTTVYVTHDQEEAMTLGDRVVVMKDGVIQQLGRAGDIYHVPSNRFVAGFLGSPPMNFLKGTLSDEGGNLVFDTGSGQLPVPGWAKGTLSEKLQPGRELVLGARPETLSSKARSEGASQLSMTVKLVQPLGDRNNVYLNTPGGSQVVAQVPTDSGFELGASLPVFFDLERVHFFEASAAGEALALNTERRSRG